MAITAAAPVGLETAAAAAATAVEVTASTPIGEDDSKEEEVIVRWRSSTVTTAKRTKRVSPFIFNLLSLTCVLEPDMPIWHIQRFSCWNCDLDKVSLSFFSSYISF